MAWREADDVISEFECCVGSAKTSNCRNVVPPRIVNQNDMSVCLAAVDRLKLLDDWSFAAIEGFSAGRMSIQPKQ